MSFSCKLPPATVHYLYAVYNVDVGA
jgi:hypothetical protein